MPKANYSQRFSKIETHIDTINSELGSIKEEMATIRTNWNWMRYIIGINVMLWVAVIGKLVVG